MKSIHKVAAVACLALSAGLVAGPTVFAQEADPSAAQQKSGASGQQGGLSDIIVTATRRATNVQDVPIAITAISGASLREGGITNPRDLTGLAPNLMVDQGLSNGQTHASIRGVASTDFGVGSLSPIAIYIDDIYQAYQFGIGTQVFDLSRVEVLRGPQGTLFGKNTTGGALAYYSQAPTDKMEGYLQGSVSGGDFRQYTGEGALNAPLTETLAMRASFRVDRRDDYIDNLYDGTELGHYTNYAGRLQFAWKPTDQTDINLKVFGIKNRGSGPVYISRYNGGECDPATFLDIYNKCVGGVAAPDSVDHDHTNADVPSIENYHTYGATLKIEQSLGDSMLTAITGGQKGKYGFRTNDDGTAGDFFHSQQSSRTEQVSQEIRIATPSNERLRAVVGAFAQYDKITADQGSGSTTIDPTTGFEYYMGSLITQKTTTFAGFGSLTFDVTDRFSLTGGLRYSYEKKENHYQAVALFGFNHVTFETRDFTEADLVFQNAINHSPPPITGSYGSYNGDDWGDAYEEGDVKDSWKRFTWDATANYKPNDDMLLYAKISTGFRSGGYPTFITSPGTFSRLDPERVTAYEAGFKSELFDRMLRFNGSVYYMKYKDMQVQTPKIPGPGLIISNAASSTIKGAEVELEFAPDQQLHMNASLGYNEASYDDYMSAFGQLGGNRLPYAPRWTASFGGSYDLPVGDSHNVQLGTNWTYRSKIYFDPYMSNDAADKGQLQGNASVMFQPLDKKWQITAYVQNLTNRLVKGFQYQVGFVSPAVYAPRRTFGLRASVNF